MEKNEFKANFDELLKNEVFSEKLYEWITTEDKLVSLIVQSNDLESYKVLSKMTDGVSFDCIILAVKNKNLELVKETVSDMKKNCADSDDEEYFDCRLLNYLTSSKFLENCSIEILEYFFTQYPEMEEEFAEDLVITASTVNIELGRYLLSKFKFSMDSLVMIAHEIPEDAELLTYVIERICKAKEKMNSKKSALKNIKFKAKEKNEYKKVDLICSLTKKYKIKLK